MSRRYARSELIGADLVFLLSVTYAGRIFRWSSRPIDVENDDNESLPYDGGLDEVEYEESFSLLSRAPDQRTLAVEVLFPVWVAQLVQRGHDLSAASGELSFIRAGDPYENRQLLLVGEVSEPQYEGENDPVSFSIESPLWDDQTMMPDSAAVVTLTTFPDAAEDVIGFYYPTVFGTPGDLQPSGEAVGATPAIVVATTPDAGGDFSDKLVIAGHGVHATQVTIFAKDEGSALCSVTSERDGLGRLVSTVDISGQSDPFRRAGEYSVGWTNGGGLPQGTGYLHGAGDLLLCLLRDIGLAIDYRRFAVALPVLNQFKFSGYFDERVNVWDWLQDNFFPLLPVSIVSGPDGLRPIVWQQGTVQPVARLVHRQGLHRAGPVTYTRRRRDLLNAFTLSFANVDEDDSYARSRTLCGEPGDDADAWASYYARVSHGRYGARGSTEDTDVVYDDNTADAILAWWARAKSLPIREVTYIAALSHAWLEPGSVVSLTDDDLALDDQQALVGSITWSLTDLTITLIIVEDPVRDLAATSS